jgi:hypothetical protein
VSTTAKWLIVAFGIAFFCIVGLIVVDRYPRFRHFFDRNHKIITILLTAVGLVVGLSAVYAARDAANAAKDQVILQTSPFAGTARVPSVDSRTRTDAGSRVITRVPTTSGSSALRSMALSHWKTSARGSL